MIDGGDQQDRHARQTDRNSVIRKDKIQSSCADRITRTETTQERKTNMTYTTKEKRTIAELRHESKMETLDQIAKAEGEYNRVTATHKATLDRKIAEYELKAKNTLKVDITNALAAIQTEEFDTDEDDNDE